MDQNDLLDLLIAMDFDARYRALCSAYPYEKSRSCARPFTRAELLGAFDAAGVTPTYYKTDRTLTVDLGEAQGRAWRFAFFASRSNHIDMAVTGTAGSDVIGTTFAILAYDSKLRENPNLHLGGLAPYPRPVPGGDPVALNAIVDATLALARDIVCAS